MWSNLPSRGVRWIWVALTTLLLTAADGHAPCAAAPSAVEAPWLEGLRQQAGGQSIILVRAPDGMVFGRSLDGSVRKDLLRTKGPYPLLDSGLELLWLYEGTQADVVDLRAKLPKRIPILRGAPADVSFKVMRSLPSGKEISIERDGVCTDELMTVSGSPPSVYVYMGDGEVDPEVHARLVGKAWLKAYKHRQGAVASESLYLWQDGAPSSAVLPPALTTCKKGVGQDSSSCGRSLDFGPKGWQVVVTTGHAPSADGCTRYDCLLYDPKTRAFASPNDPTQWGPATAALNGPCLSFLFDETVRHYLTKDKLCDLEKGCTALAGDAVGWLPPGPRVEVGF